MANDLISTQPWTPPESKTMQSIVKYGTYAAVGLGGVYAFTSFAPTLTDAVGLLDTLLQDTTHMLISGGVLIGTLWFLHETLSSNGAINKLLRLPYWMAINGLTRWFLTIDPLSPINERITAVSNDKQTFEQQFEKLDGLISNLSEKENRFRTLANKFGVQAKAADAHGLAAVKDVAVHNFGSYKEAADQYAATRARLEPIRSTFEQISKACDVTIQKLTIDRDILADKWETSKAVAGAVNSANRILGRSKTEIWNMAEQAENIVNTRYGEELGHLDHLKRAAEPFIESINLEDATYDDALFKQVQQSGTKLIESAGDGSIAPPTNVVPMSQSNAALAKLLN